MLFGKLRQHENSIFEPKSRADYVFDFEGESPFDSLSVVESGDGSVELFNEALSGTGSNCVRLDAGASSDRAYLARSCTLAPGEWYSFSFYFRRLSAINYANFSSFSRYDLCVKPNWYGYQVQYRTDDAPDTGINLFTRAHNNEVNIIHHVAVAVKRSSASGIADGEIIGYFDGKFSGHHTGIQFFDKLASIYQYFGYWYNTTLIMDIDDIKIGKTLRAVL